MAPRMTGKSKRFVQHKRKWATVRSVTATAVAVTVLVSIAYVLNRDELKIDKAIINGSESVSTEDIQKIVTSSLAGSYFGLVPRSSSIFYPRGQISANILDSFPEIKTTQISLSDMHTVTVLVSEREPYAIWCVQNISRDDVVAEDAVVTSVPRTENCYFLDSSGYSFAKAPIFSDSVFFRFYDKSKAGKLPETDRFLIEADQFRALSRFVSKINGTSLKALSLVIADDERELRLVKGGVIRFLKSQNLNDLLDSINIIVESSAFRDRELKQLEYLDMRFGNKVYYRFYGDNPDEK